MSRRSSKNFVISNAAVFWWREKSDDADTFKEKLTAEKLIADSLNPMN